MFKYFNIKNLLKLIPEDMKFNYLVEYLCKQKCSSEYFKFAPESLSTFQPETGG